MSKINYTEAMRFLIDYAVKNLDPEHALNGRTFTDEDYADRFENVCNEFADKKIMKDLQGDDLDVIELVMDVESEYDIEIDDGWLGSTGDDPSLGQLAEQVVLLTKGN